MNKKLVKCVRNKDYVGRLTLNKIYIAIDNELQWTNTLYTILNSDDEKYLVALKDRFEIINTKLSKLLYGD